ncbi:carbonic anhydrase [Endogone sp. FLAS-F59071]|nr:carbonic anhydrase [Endogone sp. FLAS-F59071]|eukprot:RUS16453.1 carbonic anhydrase [Endogone sp. FLAS-F59071]
MGNFHNDSCPFCNPDSLEKNAHPPVRRTHHAVGLDKLYIPGIPHHSAFPSPAISDVTDESSLFSRVSADTSATQFTSGASTPVHTTPGTVLSKPRHLQGNHAHAHHIHHDHDHEHDHDHDAEPQSARESQPDRKSFWGFFRAPGARDSLKADSPTQRSSPKVLPPPPSATLLARRQSSSAKLDAVRPLWAYPIVIPGRAEQAAGLKLDKALPKTPELSALSTNTGNQNVFSHRAAPNKFDPCDEKLESLLEKNQQWASAMQKERPGFFHQMASKQEPKILWIGCSDSRVPPNHIIQLDPGEIFVHRNIANIVVHNDLNCLSVVQYAVEVLKVEHIIVCGHYGCGGVAGAIHRQQYGLIDNWLMNIKDIYLENKKELQAITDPNECERRLVELNVQNSMRNVYITDTVQEAWRRGQKLVVHGWCYELATGLAKEILSCVSSQKDIEDVYQFNN